jgi:hypothetical protein
MPDPTLRLVLLQHTDRQPRGAWFEVAHRQVLATAAIQPRHALVEIDATKLEALAPDLTPGKLGPNGMPDPLPLMLAGPFQRLLELAKVGALVAPLGSTVPPKVDLPAPWSNLVVGSTVLASDDQDDGWWECIVTALEGRNRLRLRWRDFPGYNHFSKSVTQVGLPPPGGKR